MNESEFIKRLLATFKVEAGEHLEAMGAGLAVLAGSPNDREALEIVYREAHSLKGAARAVNLGELARLCHRMEDIFSDWKHGRGAPAAPVIEEILRAIDEAGDAAAALDPDAPGGAWTAGGAIHRIDEALRGETASAPGAADPGAGDSPSPADGATATGDDDAGSPSEPERAPGRNTPKGNVHRLDTVRIPAARMDAILLQSEELLGVRLSAAQRAGDLAGLNARLREWSRKFSSTDESAREELAAITYHLSVTARNADRDQRAFAALLDGLMAEIKQALMLPVGTLLEGLPKLVRDLARERRKEIDLVVEGGQLEVDRRVLEELKDPIVHIVQNCIDHAIETPGERAAANKPPRGVIAISALQREGNRFELRIRDDGRGFDTDALKEAALRSGLITAEAALDSDLDAMAMLAFHSGISTSPIITDVSGRGLGLAIVRNKVDRLGGGVSLAAEAGAGAEICLRVPITVATFRGVLVRCEGQQFLFPARAVRRVLRLDAAAVESVEGKEVLRVNGAAYSLWRLSELLGLADRSAVPQRDRLPGALLVRAGGVQIAVAVDEIIAEQEVLVKGLGRQLARVRHIAGAAILGNGALVPVLYVPDLLKSAMSGAAPAPRHARQDHDTPVRRVLLAEDSITARTLLKNILETAGFTVFPAVDGAEAWSILRTTPIDLVVSDVEMPRLNGFDLTARIRADKGLEHLPVVLITALESRDDRERGIEAGANAYIVKSSFDQSNLFETIERLL